MMVDCFWSLYNSAEDTRIDGLRTLQVQALLKCLSRASLDEWMLWQEGTDFWRPAFEVHEELQKSSGFFNAPPKPPPMAGSTKQQKADAGKRLQYDSDPDAESQISLVNVDSARETNNAADKRSSPRFILRLRLQMVIGGKIHQNESLNISMGGIKLKSPLPEGAKGSLDVRIFNGDHEMTLRCRTLQAKGEETCTRLLIEAVPKPDVFRAWILAGT